MEWNVWTDDGLWNNKVTSDNSTYNISNWNNVSVKCHHIQYGVINVFRFTFERVNLLNFCNIDTTEFLR